ncbi:MAG: hypothetical protein ABSD27_15095 [Bryobacteraceae bacterium]
MRARFGLLAALILSTALQLSAGTLAVDWTLYPLADIDGLPGQTVGWGYQITNPNAGVWLDVQSLGYPIFNVGAPTQLINMSVDDAPVLGPGDVFTQGFDPVLGLGLLSLAIDPAAVVYAMDSGKFTLTFEFWDANPLDPTSGANFLGTLDVSEPYSVTVDNPVPEPAAWPLMAGGLLLLAAVDRRTNGRRMWRASQAVSALRKLSKSLRLARCMSSTASVSDWVWAKRSNSDSVTPGRRQLSQRGDSR